MLPDDDGKKIDDEVVAQIDEAVVKLEEIAGKKQVVVDINKDNMVGSNMIVFVEYEEKQGGGLKVSDPACDLAVVAAVLSSNFDFPIPADTCFAGEVGLSGEIRPVSQADRRILEAARLGFKRIFVSSYTTLDAPLSGSKIAIVKVADIPALVRALFK